MQLKATEYTSLTKEFYLLVHSVLLLSIQLFVAKFLALSLYAKHLITVMHEKLT